jgi:hypothetical protein
MNIGAIILDWYTPAVSVDSSPQGKGQSSVTISGFAPHPVVQSLREFVENYRARETIGAVTGVLEYIEFDCDSLDAEDGWYLLTGLGKSWDKVHMDAASSLEPELGQGDTALVPFSVSAAYIGEQP